MQSRSECRSGGDCWCQTLWVNESEGEEQETEQSCLLNGCFFFLSGRVKYCGKGRGRSGEGVGFWGGKLPQSKQAPEVLTG